MRCTDIDLSSLTPVGSMVCDFADGVLRATTARAIHDAGYNIRRDLIASYLAVPGQYRFPMRVDMRVSIDVPELLLLVGAGHVSFGSPWMENRRIEDISSPAGKPRIFDNRIPFDELIDLSVFYGTDGMEIRIGGAVRYASAKERYMRAADGSGLAIGISCTKRADLGIHSLKITEYEGDAPAVHTAEATSPSPRPEAQKPTFESCVAGLPPRIISEIERTDAFLKALPQLKFKRTVDKSGNKITYVESKRGVSYALYLSGSVMHHSIQFYIVTNCEPEKWHRKSNPMEALLAAMETDAPALANRVFENLNECVGCREHCLAKTPYAHRSKTKLTCHGQAVFKMCPADFQDVRDFFHHLNRRPEA